VRGGQRRGETLVALSVLRVQILRERRVRDRGTKRADLGVLSWVVKVGKSPAHERCSQFWIIFFKNSTFEKQN
jgi:hypothetical protein